MKIQYDPDFLKTLIKLNVRIRKSFRKRAKIFLQNHLDPQLHNHILRGKYKGCRSIDITADYRVIYEELTEGGGIVAYFITIGTHNELYKAEQGGLD